MDVSAAPTAPTGVAGAGPGNAPAGFRLHVPTGRRGRKIFFASPANDTVTALDAETGRVVWQFTAGGPFRFAPAIAAGKLYAASDDGHLYCLDANTGAAVGDVRVAPGGDQVLGNGRLISRWPLRSGVLVKDGIVYAIAGVWPSEGIHGYLR